MLELARSADSSTCDMCLELLELLALAHLAACGFPDVDHEITAPSKLFSLGPTVTVRLVHALGISYE